MKSKINNFSSEKEVTKWLENLIRTDQLYDYIKNKSQVDIVNNIPKNNIPVFSFDKLSRMANLNAANEVLDSLQLLEIISIDNSVSIQTGEILRPDIICFNPEKRIFVIFEIKRDKLTERQALTEIYAYEQEIRNILPFIGNREIQTVIVSTHWDTLLEHSVSHYNAWSNKTCLALSLKQNDSVNNDFDISLIIPDAWYFRGIYGLPQNSFQTFDLLINGDFEETEGIPHKISTFVKTIVKQFDRNDIHGFLLIWKNHIHQNNGWAITFCNIDSFAIFEYCNNNEIAFRPSCLTKHISKFCSENGNISSNSLGQITSKYLDILKEDYQVEYSSYTDWKTKVHFLKLISEPIYYDFYGIVSDYVTEFTCNPIVRDLYMPFLKDNSLDWNHPLVAPTLINNLTCNQPYPKDYIGCQESFLLGSQLGIYSYLVQRYEDNKNKNIENSIKWIYSDILNYVIENNQLYRSHSTIKKNPPLLSNIHENRLKTINDYKDWINSDLIPTQEKIHNFIFNFSFDTAVVMADYFDREAVEYFLEFGSNLENIANNLRDILKFSLSYITENDLLEVIQFTEIEIFKKVGLNPKKTVIENSLILDNFDSRKLINIFKQDRFESFGKIYPPVFHSSSSETLFDSFVLDVDDAKKNLNQLYKNGHYPAIFISSNGTIGITSLAESEYKCIEYLYKDIDFNNETIFVSTSSSADLYLKKTWEELLQMFENK